MNSKININGTLTSEEKLISAWSNRSFFYGDGLFETMRMLEGKIPLWHFHWERLQSGMRFLGLQFDKGFDEKFLYEEILHTAEECSNARIRFTVYRREGGAYAPETEEAAYAIHFSPLIDSHFPFPERGLSLGIFRGLPLPCDHPFWNLKTCNSLPYVLASQFAQQAELDDCLLLNSKGYIAEATASNVFFIQRDRLFTPALEEGCVAGVLRRVLLENIKKTGLTPEETAIPPEELPRFEEIWLTNAVKGIQWVERMGPNRYSGRKAEKAVAVLEGLRGKG